MSRNTELAITIGWLLGIAVMVGYVIFMTGHSVGYKKASEDRAQWECEFEFSNKPLKEIDGKCIKYFTEEEK